MTLAELAAKVRKSLAGYPAAYRELKRIGGINIGRPITRTCDHCGGTRPLTLKDVVDGDKRLLDDLGSAPPALGDRASRN